MGTVIALNGKGGTGKTTLAALLARHLIATRAGSVLSIDADPNSSLPDILGSSGFQTIVGIVDEISRNMDKMPAGMTKERFIELRVQEAISEEKGFDLLVMGRPEGPGCYCYVNNLLRGIITRITKSYDFVIIDNAAGMEHISRRTERSIDRFVLVSDHTVFGIRSAKKIYELAKALKIKIGKPMLLINKAGESRDKAIDKEIKGLGIEVAGYLPYVEALQEMSVSGSTIFELGDRGLERSIGFLTEKIIGNRGALVCRSK